MQRLDVGFQKWLESFSTSSASYIQLCIIMLMLWMFKSSCAVTNPFVTKPWEIREFSRWFICGNPSRFQSWSMFLFIQTISWLPNCWSNTPYQHEIQLHQNYLSDIPTQSERRESSQLHTLSRQWRLDGQHSAHALERSISKKTMTKVTACNNKNIRTATRTINWE